MPYAFQRVAQDGGALDQPPDHDAHHQVGDGGKVRLLSQSTSTSVAMLNQSTWKLIRTCGSSQATQTPHAR